jgi:predicted small lipoprotein YifL
VVPFHNVLRAAILTALAVVLSLTVSACGRRGPLEAPPLSATESKDADGKPVPPQPYQQRRIPLDVLLD